VTLHLPSLFCSTVSRKQIDESSPLYPKSSWVLTSEGELVGSGGSEDKMSQCSHPPWEHCEPYIL
jgi:hypothetical protein